MRSNLRSNVTLPAVVPPPCTLRRPPSGLHPPPPGDLFVPRHRDNRLGWGETRNEKLKTRKRLSVFSHVDHQLWLLLFVFPSFPVLLSPKPHPLSLTLIASPPFPSSSHDRKKENRPQRMAGCAMFPVLWAVTSPSSLPHRTSRERSIVGISKKAFCPRDVTSRSCSHPCRRFSSPHPHLRSCCTADVSPCCPVTAVRTFVASFSCAYPHRLPPRS